MRISEVTLLGAALTIPVMRQAYQRDYQSGHDHEARGAWITIVSILVRDTLDAPHKTRRH